MRTAIMHGIFTVDLLVTMWGYSDFTTQFELIINENKGLGAI